MLNSGKLNNFLIVLVGMAGSGKSEVANYLSKKGWGVVYFGATTLKELQSRGLPRNESNERLVREEIRRIHRPQAYAKLALPSITESLKQGPTVIDGLYSWEEYKFVRENIHQKIMVIAVFTNRQERYKRLSIRKVRPLKLHEAESRDLAEIENLSKGGPIAIADYVILNNGTQEALFKSVDLLLNENLRK